MKHLPNSFNLEVITVISRSNRQNYRETGDGTDYTVPSLLEKSSRTEHEGVREMH